MEKQYITATIKFISTQDRLPPTSGNYLTMNARGTLITILPFSARHKAFNARDDDSDISYVIKISYWAYIPTEIAEVMTKMIKENTENDD